MTGMRMTKRRKMKRVREKGFTMIEVMISIAVLSILLIGIMVGNAAIRQNSEAAFERTRAIQDANQVMESIRKAASAVGNFPGTVTGTYPNGGAVAGYSNLTNETITVSYVSASANPLDTTITVSWLQNGTRAMSTSLQGLVTKK